VMPALLIPRLGVPLGVAASYLLFFLAWQPIQTITQRSLGMRAGIIRMVLFVAAAATIAFYLREMLLGLSRA
jgi:ABC-type polysaccharide transport system permease subunit